MKHAAFFIALLLLQFVELIQAQEWRVFSASDAVTNFARYRNDIWTISGSGLSKVNLLTGEKTTWNTINSNLPEYYCDVLNIDSTGGIWLGNNNGPWSKLIRFDGSSFELITEINGEKINGISDIQTSPDGKVWINANTATQTVFVFEQSQFTSVLHPPFDFIYTHSAIGVDKKSHIWVVLAGTTGAHNRVGEFDGVQWTIHDLHNFGPQAQADDAFAHDSEGNVYYLERDQLTPKLLKYNGQAWSEIILPAAAKETEFISHPLFVDKQNQIWLSLADNSLLRYDGQNWNEQHLAGFGLGNGQPDKFFLIDQDHWWLMYDTNDDSYSTRSLYNYNGVSTKQVNLSNAEIPSNYVNDIIVDEMNNKWFSTVRSLIKFDGENYTSIHSPHERTYPWPIGSTRTGGVWLYPDDSNISLFDGVAFSKILMRDIAGTPIDYIPRYQVDLLGRFIIANGKTNVTVFDHGQTIHLDTIRYESLSGDLFEDYPYHATADSSGQIYAIGNNLYRLEPDSTWTIIPLWDEWSFGYKVFVAPNKHVWVLDGQSIPFVHNFHIYDGAQWYELESAYVLGWEPQWDQDGNPWFLSDDNLCKFENETETWHCYNRSNSPLIPERIGAFTIDQYNNIWVTHENGGLMVFNENNIQHINGQDIPLVSGNIYRDVNQNGINDMGDTPLGAHRTLLLPENTLAFSNSAGSYRLSVSPGDHEIKYVPRPNWHIDNSPSSYEVTVESDTISGLDFNLVPDQELIDFQLNLIEGFPRCGQTSMYYLTFNNLGTGSATGEITFINDPNAEIGAIVPVPYFISGDTIKWLFSDIYPYGSDQISMEISIPTLPGTLLTWRGYVDVIANDGFIQSDSFLIQQEIRCSYDPNDKIARSVRSAGDGKTYLDDPLIYTIRFQNTGNDTAFNVVIRDTLDADLDLNSLEILSSSHPFEAFLKTDRTLEFRFQHILLPDSTINELASHGFITYSIKAKTGLASPTIIENTAHIYFDFNTGVVTNTAVNELIEFSTGLFHETKLVSLLNARPNPASDIIFIQAMTNNPGTIKFSLITSQGQILQTGTLQPGETAQVSLKDFPTGLYILRAEDDEAVQSISLVKG